MQSLRLFNIFASEEGAGGNDAPVGPSPLQPPSGAPVAGPRPLPAANPRPLPAANPRPLPAPNPRPLPAPNPPPRPEAPGVSSRSTVAGPSSRLRTPLTRVRIRDRCNEWSCETTKWGYDSNGKLHRVVDFGGFRVQDNELEDPDDLHSEDEISTAELITYKPLFQAEKEARASIVDNPVRVRCLYCHATFKKMGYLTDHLLGRKHTRKQSWHIPCTARVIKEKIPNNGFVPKGEYLPKMFPWCEPACVDPDYEGGRKDYTIPADLQAGIDKHHVDMRPTTQLSLSVSASTPASSTRRSYLDNPRK
ncbi:disheveled-associated activator of morphogenesis 1-A-like [Tetranychus urticae]|uniref:disheveled-associated activator of morphogenesis 1-A-like n=1 Tax=Tetranychus urticae TaxID=32264 RepID=UPI000D645C6B|nr:disheveled-associated activator of morphogenesis 1-A-like [Tetranychus urticae]